MKAKLLMIVFVLVLGTILTTALVLVDNYTGPIIAKNTAIALKSNILSALGVSYTSSDVEEIFEKTVQVESAGEREYYSTDDGILALPYEGSGLWGPISGVLATDLDLTTIKGLTVMKQEETPGLGDRITEAEYLATFIEKFFEPGISLVSPGKGGGTNEVEAISGATMSSKAFVNILNSEQSAYRSLIKGE
jgi:Na+-transporting NADH:ubiquinone oxidoreductase subunit C